MSCEGSIRATVIYLRGFFEQQYTICGNKHQNFVIKSKVSPPSTSYIFGDKYRLKIRIKVFPKIFVTLRHISAKETILHMFGSYSFFG